MQPTHNKNNTVVRTCHRRTLQTKQNLQKNEICNPIRVIRPFLRSAAPPPPSRVTFSITYTAIFAIPVVMSHPHPLHNASHHQLWRLNRMLLTPTTHALQTYTLNLLHQPLPDPLLTLRFTNTRSKLSLRKSTLTNATPELRALVTPPFLNPNTTTLTLHYESFHAFQIIRNYLYLLPINMSFNTPDIALAADRWGLYDLFHAYLYFIRTFQFPSFEAFINATLPLMQHPRLPKSFRRTIAFRLARHLHQLRHWLSSTTPNQPNEFRQTLLWQALHKQRMLTCFIKYVHHFHHTSCFDYLSFVSHGLQGSLKGVITHREQASIMSRAVYACIPRMPVFRLPQHMLHRPSVRVRIPHKSVPADGMLGTNVVGHIVVRGLTDVKLICEGERDGKVDISYSS